jgi:hypothetical protein
MKPREVVIADRLALDLETIDSMVETFQPMAKAGDVQAGALLAKFLESRRSHRGRP